MSAEIVNSLLHCHGYILMAETDALVDVTADDWVEDDENGDGVDRRFVLQWIRGSHIGA